MSTLNARELAMILEKGLSSFPEIKRDSEPDVRKYLHIAGTMEQAAILLRKQEEDIISLGVAQTKSKSESESLARDNGSIISALRANLADLNAELARTKKAISADKKRLDHIATHNLGIMEDPVNGKFRCVNIYEVWAKGDWYESARKAIDAVMKIAGTK